VILILKQQRKHISNFHFISTFQKNNFFEKIFKTYLFIYFYSECNILLLIIKNKERRERKGRYYKKRLRIKINYNNFIIITTLAK
jgi:hypothetical protein